MKTYNTYTVDFSVVGRFRANVLAKSEEDAVAKVPRYAVDELLDHLSPEEVVGGLELDLSSIDISSNDPLPQVGDRYVCLVNNPIEADVKRGDVVELVSHPDYREGQVGHLSMAVYRITDADDGKIWWGDFRPDVGLFLKLN